MRRGQVAMEFIMTYGWAILIVLVAVGALAYFGVLSPSKFLPEKCLFSTGLGCRDFIMEESGTALQTNFTISNGFGRGITIPANGVQGTFKGGTPVACTPSAQVKLAADDIQWFVCTFAASTSPGVGSQAKVGVEINYTLSDGFYPKLAAGDLSGKVQ